MKTRRFSVGARQRVVQRKGGRAARRNGLQKVLMDELTARFDGADCAGVRDDDGRWRGARGRPEHLQEPADGTFVFVTLRGRRAAGSACWGNSRVSDFRPGDRRRGVQVFVEQRMDQMRSHRGKQHACQGEPVDDLRESTLSCHESPSFEGRRSALPDTSSAAASGAPCEDDALKWGRISCRTVQVKARQWQTQDRRMGIGNRPAFQARHPAAPGIQVVHVKGLAVEVLQLVVIQRDRSSRRRSREPAWGGFGPGCLDPVGRSNVMVQMVRV